MKITVIGGGSTYTPELVQGFLKLHPDLPLDELWLMDIDAGTSANRRRIRPTYRPGRWQPLSKVTLSTEPAPGNQRRGLCHHPTAGGANAGPPQ